MHISFRSYFLKFKSPFGISKLTRLGTDTVLIELHQNGFIGYGEAVLPPYLKENLGSVIDLLETNSVLNDFATQQNSL